MDSGHNGRGRALDEQQKKGFVDKMEVSLGKAWIHTAVDEKFPGQILPKYF